MFVTDKSAAPCATHIHAIRETQYFLYRQFPTVSLSIKMIKKEINQKFKTVFYATDLLREPPLFHMYNLGKVDAYSEPHQIPKVDLFAITTFNRFKSLTVFKNSSTSDA